MRFLTPGYSYGFWLIAGLGLFLIWAYSLRRKLLHKFIAQDLIKTSLNYKRQNLKAILFILALILCVFSLMRPQWGFRWQEVKMKGLDILIAIDVSNSMLASDVAPNRLERSNSQTFQNNDREF